MVHWEDPALQARLGTAATNIIFLLLGLYGWEYISTFEVEYAVLRGRLAFRWTLVPYITGRIFIFVSLILLAIKTDPPSPEFNCLPVTAFTAIAGDIGLACTSINLMIRTWVIWKDSRLVHVLLMFLVIGHWIVLILDVENLHGAEVNEECIVDIVHPAVNGAVFVYSLCYDLVVLVLSIAGLSRQLSKSPLRKRLRAQGVIYFVVAVVTYIAPTVFALLDVDSMLSITGLTAMIASNIASCRAVRSLLGLRAPPDPSQMSKETAENQFALTSQIPIQTVAIMAC